MVLVQCFSSLESKLFLDFTHVLDLYTAILFLFFSRITLRYGEAAWCEPAVRAVEIVDVWIALVYKKGVTGPGKWLAGSAHMLTGYSRQIRLMSCPNDCPYSVFVNFSASN